MQGHLPQVSFFADCITFSRQRIHRDFARTADLHTADSKSRKENNSPIIQARTPPAGVLFCGL